MLGAPSTRPRRENPVRRTRIASLRPLCRSGSLAQVWSASAAESIFNRAGSASRHDRGRPPPGRSFPCIVEPLRESDRRIRSARHLKQLSRRSRVGRRSSRRPRCCVKNAQCSAWRGVFPLAVVCVLLEGVWWWAVVPVLRLVRRRRRERGKPAAHRLSAPPTAGRIRDFVAGGS